MHERRDAHLLRLAVLAPAHTAGIHPSAATPRLRSIRDDHPGRRARDLATLDSPGTRPAIDPTRRPHAPRPPSRTPCILSAMSRGSATILALGLLAACYVGPAGEGSTAEPSTSTTTTSPATTLAPTTGEPGTTTSTGPATTESSTSSGAPVDSTGSPPDLPPDPPPDPPAIHYVGRVDVSDPARVRMGWSGVGAVVRFTGTGASVTLDDHGRWFTVVVDGAVQQPLKTTGGAQTYPLAAGLAPGEHTIELYRRTEGSFGETAILGFTIDGELLAPPPVTRRIELIGDSITAGYGDEGVAPCSFSAETENHYLTYGAIAARALAAELHTIAWSGKGVIYNFGDDKTDPLPNLYDRLQATDGAPWDFSWQPDVVAINLGTNDFSTGGDPPEATFVGAYVTFLTHLRAVYPNAQILLLAPSLFGGEVDLVAGYLESVVAARHGAGDLAVDFADINVQWLGSGCDGHPDLATHAAMADNLIAELQARLGW